MLYLPHWQCTTSSLGADLKALRPHRTTVILFYMVGTHECADWLVDGDSPCCLLDSTANTPASQYIPPPTLQSPPPVKETLARPGSRGSAQCSSHFVGSPHSALLCLDTSVLSHFSHVSLFATLWTVACQVPLSIGILQARILKWVAMPSSRGSSWPRDRTHLSYVSCIGRQEVLFNH